MIITPRHTETYNYLLENFEQEKRKNLPKEERAFIERHNQPPISAFLNVSLHNHQNRLTRVGHVSLSLSIPIHLDILAWCAEQRDKAMAMTRLKQALTVDLVSVAETRNTPRRPHEDYSKTCEIS